MSTPAQPPTPGRERADEKLERTPTAGQHAPNDGGNSRAHEYSGDIGERSARHSEQTAEARLDAADERDEIALARDLAARTRDDAAETRSIATQLHDAYAEQDRGSRPLTDTVIRNAGQRHRAARRRARSAEHGALAAHDREAAARDREHAARERLHALVDREVLADELAIAGNDPLTGARTRAAGLTDLDHELERCRRTGGPLAVAYVDVVGLKALNDSEGHRAGDELLERAVQLMREHLRPYDLIIRLGGDEFLCAMSDATATDAAQRFSVIALALAEAPRAAAIRTGFAELAGGESAAELIGRADRQLIDQPHAVHDSGRVPSAGSPPRPRRSLPARARRSLPAQAESVAPLRRAVVAFASGCGASAPQCEDIALAVSEALNNAVLHAYRGRDDPGIVSVDAYVSGRSLEVVVCDAGGGMLQRGGRPCPGLGLGLGLIVRMTERLELTEAMPGVRLRMSFAIG